MLARDPGLICFAADFGVYGVRIEALAALPGMDATHIVLTAPDVLARSSDDVTKQFWRLQAVTKALVGEDAGPLVKQRPADMLMCDVVVMVEKLSDCAKFECYRHSAGFEPPQQDYPSWVTDVLQVENFPDGRFLRLRYLVGLAAAGNVAALAQSAHTILRQEDHCFNKAYTAKCGMCVVS